MAGKPQSHKLCCADSTTHQPTMWNVESLRGGTENTSIWLWSPQFTLVLFFKLCGALVLGFISSLTSMNFVEGVARLTQVWGPFILYGALWCSQLCVRQDRLCVKGKWSRFKVRIHYLVKALDTRGLFLLPFQLCRLWSILEFNQPESRD